MKDGPTMQHRTWMSARRRARRGVLAAWLAAGLGVALGWAGLSSVAAAAAPPLPQRNLSVEARVVESSALEREAVGGVGSVVIGTGGGSVTLPAGSVGVRAGTDTLRGDSIQRVLVLNGGRATVRLSQWLPLRSAEWVWAGNGIGIGGSTVWVDIGQGLTVRPAWPGGSQPVRAEVAVESAGRNDLRGTAPDASTPRLAVSTEVSLPLGEWVSVAQMFDDNSSAGTGTGVSGRSAGVVTSTRSLRRELSVQLRVTVP